MLVILHVIIKKANLNLHFDNAIKNVSDELENSENKKQISEKDLATAKEMTKNLPEKIKEIEAISDEKIKTLKSAILNDLEKQKANVILATQKTIASEKQKIYTTLTQETLKKAVETAKENIIRKLNEDVELHNEFINNSIKELDVL